MKPHQSGFQSTEGPDPSIERTITSGMRPLPFTAHVERWNQAMNLPTLNCARAIRDGGIDAVAALDTALAAALVDAPPDSHPEIKLAIGHAMAAVLDATVNLAVRAYPELEPSEETWVAVAKARAAARRAS